MLQITPDTSTLVLLPVPCAFVCAFEGESGDDRGLQWAIMRKSVDVYMTA